MGNKTIEGHISGDATLAITDLDGKMSAHPFPSDTTSQEVIVDVGQLMQWYAHDELIF